jgi:uncharacterized membrane protein YfcA
VIFAGMVGIGLVVGLLIGLTGIGGGSLATPMLILSGISPATAVGTSLTFSFVTKLSGSISFVRRRLVHFEIVRDLSLGCLPGTLTGAFVIRYLGLRRPETLDAFMLNAIGTVLIVVALVMLLRLLPGRVRPRLVDRTFPVASWQRSLVIALVGFAVGVVVTITSIGSAAALIPAMVLFYRLDSGTLVGTNVFMGTIMAGIAAIPHAGLGHVDWMSVLGLVIGSVPGVWITSRWHGHIPRHIPEGIIAVALLAMGVRIVLH